LPYLDNSVAA